jgi:hypothetical protein
MKFINPMTERLRRTLYGNTMSEGTLTRIGRPE